MLKFTKRSPLPPLPNFILWRRRGVELRTSWAILKPASHKPRTRRTTRCRSGRDHCDSALFFVWNCPRNWNETETKLCQTSYWNCFETLKCADSLTLLSFNSAYCGIGFRRGLYTEVVGRGVSLTLSIPAISPAASGAALVLDLVGINYITVNLVS